METVVKRPAALDVHKEQVTACVRVPGGRGQHVAEFRTTVQGLLALRDWLKAHGATSVVMEASGVYWKPPWAILEDEFECMLVNARHVKQVPGRKTDVSGVAWLCQLLEAGLLTTRSQRFALTRSIASRPGSSKTHLRISLTYSRIQTDARSSSPLSAGALTTACAARSARSGN